MATFNPLDLILLATFTGIGTALGNKIFQWFERRSNHIKEKLAIKKINAQYNN